MRIISIRRGPDKDLMDERSSVLDLLDDSEEGQEFIYHNGRKEVENGHEGEKAIKDIIEDGQRPNKRSKIEKRVELKSLLGNSLGSYWNDGSMMVEKRRRKQVVRFTTEDEIKNETEENNTHKTPPTKKKSTTSDNFDKLNLKMRARPHQKNVKEENGTLYNDRIPKFTDSPSYKSFEINSQLNSTFETDEEEDTEPVYGSQRRKRHMPYTKNPISVACHMARKPVKNFNLCPYKQPSKLFKECANYLIRDHSAVPLILALDVTELIHVSQYKVMLQNKGGKVRRKQGQTRAKDIDNRRPGYSRAKEELKQFLCSVTVERKIHAQQRSAGKNDPEYQKQKAKLIEFLNSYKP